MGMALIPWWGPALPALIEILAQITWKSATPAPEFGPKNIISEGQYYHRESIQRVSANSGVYRKVLKSSHSAHFPYLFGVWEIRFSHLKLCKSETEDLISIQSIWKYRRFEIIVRNRPAW